MYPKGSDGSFLCYPAQNWTIHPCGVPQCMRDPDVLACVQQWLLEAFVCDIAEGPEGIAEEKKADKWKAWSEYSSV